MTFARLPSSVKHLLHTTSHNMPRITLSALPQTARFVPSRSFVAARRNFAKTPENGKGDQNATPGWEGRHGDDHVLHRDKLDSQGKASNEAREQKQAGQEGSSAISERDERNSTQKAREEHPEAPGPIIGMNSGKVADHVSMQPLITNRTRWKRCIDRRLSSAIDKPMRHCYVLNKEQCTIDIASNRQSISCCVPLPQCFICHSCAV